MQDRYIYFGSLCNYNTNSHTEATPSKRKITVGNLSKPSESEWQEAFCTGNIIHHSDVTLYAKSLEKELTLVLDVVAPEKEFSVIYKKLQPWYKTAPFVNKRQL